ncbi:hypothetical protein EMCRGX_G018053 [Ephydatia muelleri]
MLYLNAECVTRVQRLTQCRTKHSNLLSGEKMSVYQASIDIPPHPLMVSIPFQVLSMAPVPTLDCLQLRAILSVKAWGLELPGLLSVVDWC